jgi:hypothetical protein
MQGMTNRPWLKIRRMADSSLLLVPFTSPNLQELNIHDGSVTHLVIRSREAQRHYEYTIQAEMTHFIMVDHC